MAGHFSAYTLIFLLQQKRLYTVLLVLLLENTETLNEGVIIGKKKNELQPNILNVNSSFNFLTHIHIFNRSY